MNRGINLIFFPENLKNKVKRLLKSELRNNSCCETCQNYEVSLVPPKKPKVQLPKDDVPTNFLSFFSTFKPETSANTQESEQNDLADQEIETEFKSYLAEESLSTQNVKEAEVISLMNSNKKKHSSGKVCKKVTFSTFNFCLSRKVILRGL